MTTHEEHEEKEKKELAGNLAFGITQTVACSLIDIVGDPLIGEAVQNRLAPEHKGKEVHARKAEIAGDVSGLFIFLGVQKFLPGIVKGIKGALKPLLSPTYEKIGRKRLPEWAERHNIDMKSAAFNAKLIEWKDEQIENVAKAAVLSSASVVTNVVIQKALKNPRDWSVIALGKIAGATVTMGATLAARAFAPRTMHRIDSRIEKHIAAPLIRHAHKIFDVEGHSPPQPHTDALNREAKSPELVVAGR